MSQTLFAICLFAGVLAMASAQSFDWSKCSRIVQEEANSYRETAMQSGQKFMNNMQDTAGKATDMSAVQKNIDKMTQSISSLANMSQNFDMGQVTSVYMENMQTMVEIGRQTWRPALISGGMGSYMDFINEMMSSNMKFMQTVTNSCMPGNRRS